MINEELKQLIDNSDIVSFDVFDTLILRPFVKPEDVFFYLSELKNTPDFAKERLRAEKQAMILAFARQKKEFATFDDIYKLIKPNFSFFKDIERDFELKISSLNSEIFEVYNYALNSGKKIILTTDMYFSKDFIAKILDKVGISGYDEIFVSSEIGLSKVSGNLFKHILSKYEIEPKKICHIGDNEISDYKMPKSVGINVFLYRKVIDRFLSDENNKYMNIFYENSFSPQISALIGFISINQFRNINKDYWYNLGYNIGGIFALSFVLNIIERLNDNAKDLLFIARDGYVLEKVFKIYNKNKSIKPYYVYLNRVLKDKYKNCLENNSLFEYIKHFNLSDKIGIVDSCAKSFSAQDLLETFLNRKLTGFYLCAKSNPQYTYFNLSDVDWSNFKYFNWNFVEFLLTSTENPIIDINDNKPIYMENIPTEEEQRKEFYKFVSQGELDFANDMKEKFGEYILLTSVPFVMSYVSCFWNNLSSVDREHLSKIKHQIDPNKNIYISVLDSYKDFAKILRERMKTEV